MQSVRTERLFWADPYLQEFTATITSIEGNAVALDRTAFYANSGGQIGDTGTLNDIPVTDTQYLNEGDLVHFLQSDAEPLEVGMQVLARSTGSAGIASCVIILHNTACILRSKRCREPACPPSKVAR